MQLTVISSKRNPSKVTAYFNIAFWKHNYLSFHSRLMRSIQLLSQLLSQTSMGPKLFMLTTGQASCILMARSLMISTFLLKISLHTQSLKTSMKRRVVGKQLSLYRHIQMICLNVPQTSTVAFVSRRRREGQSGRDWDHIFQNAFSLP